MLTEGALNKFPDEVVPKPIEAILIAKWLNGAVSLEWLLEHPDWYDWAEIVMMATNQAKAATVEKRGE